jgi:hypothetical protein
MSRLKVVYVVDHDPVSRSRIRRLLARPGWSLRTLDGLAAKPLDENLARMAGQLLDEPQEDDRLPRAL